MLLAAAVLSTLSSGSFYRGQRAGATSGASALPASVGRGRRRWPVGFSADSSKTATLGRGQPLCNKEWFDHGS